MRAAPNVAGLLLPLMLLCASADVLAAEHHPLQDRIWSSTDSRFISREQALERLRAADLILLGEKQDNPHHHQQRLALLDDLLAQHTSQAPALLVMEMLSQAQQAGMDQLSGSQPPAAEWPALLHWDQGWTWQHYQPVLELALTREARVMAGNIDPATVMDIYRQDVQPSGLDATQLEQLTQEIDISHCGMLPASQIPAMVRVQQARDRQMAAALTVAGEFSARILLAGNFHIRQDLGVPNYLLDADTAQVLSLAFLEVSEEGVEPADYLAGAQIYDLIWFTPAVEVEDYCQAFSQDQ